MASDLLDLYAAQLKDLHSAEGQQLDALPRLAARAREPELTTRFAAMVAGSKERRALVERLLAVLGDAVGGGSIGPGLLVERILGVFGDGDEKVCHAMRGLLAEGREAVRDNADHRVRDAALIAAAQRVAHYGIAGYGTVAAYADFLERPDDAASLTAALRAIEDSDRGLTALARRVVNPRAVPPGAEGRGARLNDAYSAATDGASAGRPSDEPRKRSINAVSRARAAARAAAFTCPKPRTPSGNEAIVTARPWVSGVSPATSASNVAR